jgi:hypothetical protein
MWWPGASWDDWVTGMPSPLAKTVRTYNNRSRLLILNAWDACDANQRRRYSRRLRWTIPGMRRYRATRLARQLLTKAE